MACGMDYSLAGLNMSIQQDIIYGSWQYDQYLEVTNYTGTPTGYQDWTYSQSVSRGEIMADVLADAVAGYK